MNSKVTTLADLEGTQARFGKRLKGVEVRFWEKVRKGAPDECWLWTGVTDKGYGKLRVAGRKVWPASRISFVIYRGFVRETMEVCHSCDTPGCVNPVHLFEGTHADNLKDASIKGRFPTGARHPMTKVSDENVLKIKKLCKEGDLTQKEIGKLFGISRSHTGSISRGIRRVLL